MPSRSSSPELVGRDEALATLTGALGSSLAGAPAFSIVRGEAGIGKSRLVGEAVARLPGGTRCLVGECLDVGQGGLPYLPLAEVLRRLARTLPPATLDRVLGPGRGDLATLAPELALGAGEHGSQPSWEPPTGALSNGALPTGAPGPPERPELTSGLAQARLFERVLGVLRALSVLDPVVLLVEDVHWIDRATRDLLTFLLRNLTDERIAIVLTARAGELPPGHPILGWLADIARSSSTTVVELPRLEEREVDRQLRALAGADLPPGLASGIWHRSQGNPLFVEELYAAASSGATAVSSSVEVLLVRFARLDPAARAVSEAASIAARPIDDRLVAAVLKMAPDDVDRALADAIAAGVLEVDPATDLYRFRHELLREAVERQLLPGARRRLHEAFVRCLQAHPELADPSPAGAAGELAIHAAAAGLVADAYRLSTEAAGAAENVHAYADAFAHLERALDLEGRLPAGVPEAHARAQLRTRAADDADLAGAFDRALELTRAALGLVDAAADPVTAGLLHSRIGYLQWSLGDGPGALASHEEAVRLVPEAPPSPERAKVLGSLGGALMGEGRWAASKVVCEAAIACAIAAEAPAEESRARNMLGSDLVALGDMEGGLEELRAARRIAEAARREDMLIVAHYNLALNLIAADQLDSAIKEATAGRETARSAGLERRFGQELAALLADALVRLGRLDDAAEALASGLALSPDGNGTMYLATVRARLAAVRGDVVTATRWRAGIDLLSLDPDVAAFVAAVAAESLLLESRPADATAIAEAGLERLDGLDDVLWSAPLVALATRGLADQAEMARARRPALPDDAAGRRRHRLHVRLDELAARVTTGGGRGHVALARGELDRMEGRHDAGAWLSAIAAFDAIPDPLAAAYARLRAAEAALHEHGLRADVADLLRDAGAVAGQTGARPLAEAVATLAARARLAPTAAPGIVQAQAQAHAQAPDPEAAATRSANRTSAAAAKADADDPRAAAMALGLSAREVEVLALVAAGYTNGEIAEQLFISRKTAAVHVTHILDKLGVANRVGAAMIGARVGVERLAPGYDTSE